MVDGLYVRSPVFPINGLHSLRSWARQSCPMKRTLGLEPCKPILALKPGSLAKGLQSISLQAARDLAACTESLLC
jgi:hypothetical protein